MKKELESLTIEVNNYKEKLKLADKQEKSTYSKENWPMIYSRYQTLELLGSGGFGQVFKCYDIETNKIVAIKKIMFDSKVSAKYKDEFFKHVKREV